MKKLLFKAMSVVMVMSFLLSFMVGCSSNSTQEESTTTQEESTTTQEETSNDSTVPETSKVAAKVGLGLSENADTKAAVEDCLAAVSKDVSNPQFIVTFMDAKYDLATISSAINSKFSSAKVFGSTSINEIISSKGITKGMGIMAIEDPDLKVGTGIQDFKGDLSEANVAKVAKTAIDAAVKDAGVTATEKPKMIYLSAVCGTEEYVIKSLTDVYGKDVPITGGSPGHSGDNWGVWGVIGNSTISKDGLVITCIYGGEKAGTSFKAGFAVDETKKGTVTKMTSPRLLAEIDGKPAGDVMNTWAEGGLTEFIKNGKTTIENQFQLLARKFDVNGRNETSTTAFTKIDPKTKEVEIWTNLNVGDTIYYITAKKDILLNRVEPLVKESVLNGKMKMSDTNYGVMILCGGARGFIGGDLNKVTEATNSAFGGKPWIGAVSNSEQGYIEGYGTFQGNYMNSFTVFGK